MSNRFFTARRLLPRAAFRDCGKAVVAGIVLADARERGVQHGHGAALAAGDLAGDVCGGAGHGRNTEADSSSTGSASSTKLAAMSWMRENCCTTSAVVAPRKAYPDSAKALRTY
ncbi:hypothetical protein G6F31_014919 [Rhizopus arrhizus]|nr:hypothetical protein G6F31_014919 [Rhizopus arrhizus]